MSAQEPDEGEVWYARVPGAFRIVEARVTDLTAKTVEVEFAVGEIGPMGRPKAARHRYERADVSFIERKSPAPVAPAHVGEGWPKPEE